MTRIRMRKGGSTMPNPDRHMATLRRIDGVTPIDGADRIEAAHVGGWDVVIGKGDFHEGDIVVFFEIDTFFPKSDKHFAFLMPRGTKRMIVVNDDGSTSDVIGHVLRTAKMRGVYSQGLLMSPQDFGIDIDKYDAKDIDSHPDVTSICGVWEYVPPMPIGQVGIIGRFNERYAHRTDAVRIQNISPVAWQAMHDVPFHATVKVDGMSTTVRSDADGTMHVYSHANELDTSDGNSLGKEILQAYEASGIAQWCRQHTDYAVQGEFFGSKINGNRLGVQRRRVMAFALWHAYTETSPRRKEDPYAIGFVDEFKYSFVPTPDGPDGKPLMSLDAFATPSDLIDFVSNHLVGNVMKGRLDEGIVLHYVDDGSAAAHVLRDELGENMEVKVISNRYLLKAKE